MSVIANCNFTTIKLCKCNLFQKDYLFVALSEKIEHCRRSLFLKVISSPKILIPVM